MNMSWEEYLQDRRKYSELNKDEEFEILIENERPILGDKYTVNGPDSDQFFAYPIWVGKKVFESNPKVHYDIGSQIDTVIANFLTFRESLVMITNKWLPANFENQFHSTVRTNLNIYEEVKKLETESVESLSMCNLLEHIGLGRYGEEIKVDIWIDLIQEIKRILTKDGRFYMTTRIGKEDTLMVNRYRQFMYETLLRAFEPLELQEMSISAGKKALRSIYRNEMHQYIYEKNVLEMIEKEDGGLIAMFEFVRR